MKRSDTIDGSFATTLYQQKEKVWGMWETIPRKCTLSDDAL